MPGKHKAGSHGGKKKIRHMEIRKAENGFTTNTHFEPQAGKMGMDSYLPSEEHVHKNAKAVAKHVMASFGDDEAGEDNTAAEVAGSPAAQA